jgi:hypothetical protein
VPQFPSWGTFWFFSGSREEPSLLVLRVKVLGLSPGAAPLPFLAGALHTLPGLGFSDDLRAGLRFMVDIERRATFLTFCIQNLESKT